MPTTAEERRAIVEAAKDVDRAEAVYKAAVARFDALIEGQRFKTTTALITGFDVPELMSRKGKAPDPTSLSQRVLTMLSTYANGLSISEMAESLKSDAKSVRNAVVYHQKRGLVVHAGKPETFVMKTFRENNGNGVNAVNQ